MLGNDYGKEYGRIDRFYKNIIGLDIIRRFGGAPGNEITFLGNGETQIELICNTAKTGIIHSQNISIGFKVDSLDRMMKFITEKNIEIHSGPFQPNEYIKFFYVLDPNGLKVQFVEIIRK